MWDELRPILVKQRGKNKIPCLREFIGKFIIPVVLRNLKVNNFDILKDSQTFLHTRHVTIEVRRIPNWKCEIKNKQIRSFQMWQLLYNNTTWSIIYVFWLPRTGTIHDDLIKSEHPCSSWQPTYRYVLSYPFAKVASDDKKVQLIHQIVDILGFDLQPTTTYNETEWKCWTIYALLQNWIIFIIPRSPHRNKIINFQDMKLSQISTICKANKFSGLTIVITSI